MTKHIQFPKDFLWGCATSAYQIEGSPLADGAGPSVWHRFSHTPGRVQDGDTADITCDHYRRYESDVDLMQSLGVNSYRFSIAWGRVLPEGTGRINAAGLDFYERLVDRLLSRGIQPMVTLFHWDLPAALDDRGGWLNRDIAKWFADYADIVFRRLDDRVQYWTTLNEPWVVVDGGYLHGVLAPGHRNIYEAPLATHHLMMAHGAAVQAYRATGRNQIGLVVNIEPKYPASQADADLAATRRAEAYMNRQYLDPAIHGTYPEELVEVFGEAWPQWPASDLELIRQPIDYLGVNYYTRSVVRSEPNAWPLKAAPVKQKQHTHTENGAAFFDPPQVEGPVLEDPLRVDYLRKHITAVYNAIQRGADIRGYFAWSLFDNFEWAYGFSKRFGLVHMNYETLERTLKASAHFYSKVIATNGAALTK